MMRLPHHFVLTLLMSLDLFFGSVGLLVLARFAGKENEALAVGF